MAECIHVQEYPSVCVCARVLTVQCTSYVLCMCVMVQVSGSLCMGVCVCVWVGVCVGVCKKTCY